MNHSTSVHHQLLEFTQTHAHRVSNAIQPSHLLLSPSPPDFNLSQHQGLFKWVSFWASLVAQMVKRLPTMQETWVRFLGRKDLLEKEMATHSSTLAWKIPWMEETGKLQSIGLQRVRHDWVTSLSFFLCFFLSLFLSFTSGGQSIGVSASTSVLPMNTEDWSPLGWTGWISLQTKGLSRVLQHHSSKASILQCSAFLTV